MDILRTLKKRKTKEAHHGEVNVIASAGDSPKYRAIPIKRRAATLNPAFFNLTPR